MTTLYRFLLAFHIVAIISWMAGLLYLWRLFVYHAEETETLVKSRFIVMEEKLYRIITMPAMGVAFILGFLMVALNPSLLSQGWFHGKLLFVALMIAVTIFAGKIKRELAQGICRYPGKTFRILNEVPTLLMIIIVLLVILKPFT